MKRPWRSARCRLPVRRDHVVVRRERAVEDAARHAAEAVREGGGPHFLELRTYRFRAHSMYDPDRYRDKAEIERWKRHDPIDALARREKISNDDLALIEKDLAVEISDAVDFAEAAAKKPVEDLTRFVYSSPAFQGGLP